MPKWHIEKKFEYTPFPESGPEHIQTFRLWVISRFKKFVISNS
ncbi:Uncharacterized protein dnm_081530 [Desulfonema magnum]|uniref:Uncharacterized protein n=1 Tax=Desulfonema magnum TaxID=45655 RepID=A0A975BVP1_9BACT|nr:Uncharacterized protein dnm_081530 [Desulfonema magnum]